MDITSLQDMYDPRAYQPFSLRLATFGKDGCRCDAALPRTYVRFKKKYSVYPRGSNLPVF